jgi:hypothetical protein
VQCTHTHPLSLTHTHMLRLRMQLVCVGTQRTCIPPCWSATWHGPAPCSDQVAFHSPQLTLGSREGSGTPRCAQHTPPLPSGRRVSVFLDKNIRHIGKISVRTAAIKDAAAAAPPRPTSAASWSVNWLVPGLPPPTALMCCPQRRRRGKGGVIGAAAHRAAAGGRCWRMESTAAPSWQRRGISVTAVRFLIVKTRCRLASD